MVKSPPTVLPAAVKLLDIATLATMVELEAKSVPERVPALMLREPVTVPPVPPVGTTAVYEAPTTV
jgi:hypothetical protein